jgi:hypothetical protein
MAGFFDNLLADPTSAQGMQNAGTFGGLQALGAALAQAGAMRPVGAPGPGLADAFTAYGTGRRQGLLGAMQGAQMARQQARQGLLADARDANKPDEALNPQALAMRRALSSLPENVRALADDEQVPQLAIKQSTERLRQMNPEELAAGGFRPGSVVMVNDFTGNPNVVQQPDVMSPEAFAQKLRLTAAGRGPTVSWRDEFDAAGNLIGQRSTTGQFQPITAKPMSRGQAMMTLAQLGTAVAEGKVKPGMPEFEKYSSAYSVASEPKTEYVPNPQSPGMLMAVTRPGPGVPDRYPNPETLIAGLTQPPQTASPAAAQPTPAVPAPAPVQAAPEGVPIPGTAGMTATPPLPPLPRDQSGAIRATPQATEQVRKGELEAARVGDAIANFRDVLKENPTGWSTWLNNPTDPKAQKVNMAYERVKIVMRGESLMNTGVLQPGENVGLENMLLSPMTLRGAIAKPEAYEARLREIEKMMIDSYNASRKQVGLPPISSLSSVGAGAASRSGGAIPPPPPGFVR